MSTHCSHSPSSHIWRILPETDASVPSKLIIGPRSCLADYCGIDPSRTCIHRCHWLTHNDLFLVYSCSNQLRDSGSLVLACSLYEDLIVVGVFRGILVEILHIVKIGSFVYFCIDGGIAAPGVLAGTEVSGIRGVHYENIEIMILSIS